MRYVYDALGRRVRRHIAGSRENTKFTYDGEDVLMDDDSGTVTKYLNGPGIDNKLRSTNGSNVSYFLSDQLGSTNGLTNASGAVTASNSYDSFGNATNTSFPSRYQFTGREFDNFTGLQFSRARFYDPNLGRFISEDSIGFSGGDINLYGYIRNNPTQFGDPMGLFPWTFGDNPYDLIPESGWIAIAYAGNFAAGFGDTVTLGGTNYIREAMGTNGVIDPCSNVYFAGDVTGTILPMLMGGAGIAKGALAMGGRSGGLLTRFGRGAGRFFQDPRSYGAVRANYWNKVTGFGPANGRSLHHWYSPQRAGGSNAGWNLVELPIGLNRWMGYNQGMGRVVEHAIRAAIPGSLAGGTVAGGIWGASKSEWKSKCGCR